MRDFYGIRCERCGSAATDLIHFRCVTCAGPLQLRYDLEKLKGVLEAGWQSQVGSLLNTWKRLLPIDEPELIPRVSCGERESALVRSIVLGEQAGSPRLFFKLEYSGPSLSLKDRGTALCVLKALEFGHTTLCVASSGNNAASVAAYAAKAGLLAIVFVQRRVSPAKLTKALAHGARIVRVDGTMSDASRVCGELAARYGWFNCGGANPYRSASKRTVAYAMTAQLGSVPDVVVFPVGGGTGMASAHFAFHEMHAMGLIRSLPRMVGVQFEACDPVARAFKLRRDSVEPMNPRESASDALMNGTPFWGTRVLKAATETGGAIVSVTDDECRRVMEELATREGLFLEPAGAISVAGFQKLRAESRIEPSETVVCMLTGHGANTAHDASEPTFELVAPEPSAIESYLGL